MNMIKNKFLVVTVVAALFITPMFSGCKKFLDRKPLSATVDDLQVGALDGQVLGLYGAVRNSKNDPYCGDGFENIPWVAMNGFRSDDAEIVADPGASAWHQTYDNFAYTKDDWGAGLYWDKHYVFIGLCNDALDLAVRGNYTDAASIINIAEAKFFRAYAYFDLVRTFGEVPKIDFKIKAKQFVKIYSQMASIMPFVPRANTNLTSIMIGEMIGERLRREPERYRA